VRGKLLFDRGPWLAKLAAADATAEFCVTISLQYCHNDFGKVMFKYFYLLTAIRLRRVSALCSQGVTLCFRSRNRHMAE
jgi:hypothetical protein